MWPGHMIYVVRSLYVTSSYDYVVRSHDVCRQVTLYVARSHDLCGHLTLYVTRSHDLCGQNKSV